MHLTFSPENDTVLLNEIPRWSSQIVMDEIVQE